VTEPLDRALLESVRRARLEFYSRLQPVRPDLYRYCRRLTASVWDAEDLLQETLAKAFAAAAESHQRVERPLPWLLRIATNTYVDWSRRRPALPVAELDGQAAAAGADPTEVRDALVEMATLLPPQERAALVLKDVFELPLAEIAAMLCTSVGAVKSALHRARGRLVDPGRQRMLAVRPQPDRAVVDALADAFTAYDLDRLTALFLANGTSEVVGVVREVGREQIRAGSLHHTLVVEDHVRYRAQVRDLDGEPVVLLWATPVDGSGPEAVEDVLRVETADGGVARLRWYYFCPESLTEVAERLAVTVRPNAIPTHG
jgi:RNA polymerase sigma-70 factor, ECF subfamily